MNRKIKENIIQLLNDKYLYKMVKVFLLVIIIYLTIGILRWKKLNPEIPLFYSLPRGTHQLGTPFALLILPSLSILFFGSNFLLASFIYKEEKLAAFILIMAGLVSTFIFLLAYLKIIFLTT